MRNDSRLETEAQIFCSYLVGGKCPQSVQDRYARIVGTELPEKHKDLDFASRHPWSIGMLDGGLAFLQPTAELRRRIYIMFAILESTPEFSDKFLPRQHSPLYLLAVAFQGVRAAARAALGMTLLKLRRIV